MTRMIHETRFPTQCTRGQYKRRFSRGFKPGLECVLDNYFYGLDHFKSTRLSQILHIWTILTMTYLWPILLLPAALAIPPPVPNGSISSSATTSHPTYITTTTTTELTTVVAGTVLVTSVVTVEPCLSTTLGLPSQDHNSAQHSSSEGGEHGFEFDTWSPGMPTATTLFRDGERDGGGGGSSGSDPRALTRGSSTAVYAGTSSDNLALGTSSSAAAAAVSIATSDPLAIHGTGSTAGGISSTSTQDPLAVGPSGSLPGSITSSSSATNSQDHLAISTPSSVIGISSSATSPRSSTTSVHGPGPFGISSSAALSVKPSSQTATASGPSTNWTYASPVQPSATPLSTVTPCMQNKTDAGLQACRLALGTTCDRSSNEYPTCVNGQCACQAVECASDGECVGFRQCFADETASCKFSNSSSSSSNATSSSASSSVSSSTVTTSTTSRNIMNITSAIIAASGPGKAMTTSSSRGVCQCQPKGGGCLVQRDPDRYCAEHAPCSDPSVNGAFPAHAQCVMQDAFGFYLFGRCKCQTVDCPWAWPAVPDNARKNRDSCAKLILCKDDEAPTAPMCVAKPWGPSPMRHDPATRGYCACVGR